ncbi:chemotaxis protein CheA [Pigmentiphaga sp. GD03639]|uniref:histidine kinase n=1 Tax=Pigmentiphaga daeguensis TaxID=414049 RepID=A0ABP3LAB5_9BURK|nr:MULTISPECIES: chemotaxis protein CheA [unclassified Pigmentiphaga]MDH2237653.1 chemotaxis protein CheA [Pigmentiphaga sp. GD03639]OVZ58716.1 chemotaxis protein CheA [Pigmentiphaga sp. NML030171]
MSAFSDMQDLLADFLTEASDLLDDVDIGLVELEQRPDDAGLLNQVFRGFHTVKGGAGFLEATPLVELCHRGENLLDLLRGGSLRITPEIMDVILAATGEVRRMFSEMERGAMPEPAPAGLLLALEAAAMGETVDTSTLRTDSLPAAAAAEASRVLAHAAAPAPRADSEPDWLGYYRAAFGDPPGMQVEAPAAAEAGAPASSRPYRPEMLAPAGGAQAVAKDATIRVDTARFDQILNLSGEIGLTKNRLSCLRDALLGTSRRDDAAAETLDAVFSQLDTLVSDLQSAVMMARMQPVGRVFQKYSRLARDLARQLGKDVELNITGGETEVDKTILDELNDPLVHLIRNAVDHGIETMVERRSVGKPARGTVHLSARQTGDSIVIEVSDDGRGMDPDVIRRKAIEKGVISAEDAAVLDNAHCLQLIFLPGFSTRSEVSDLSGRGVGMDVVKTNIEKLKGQIDIQSAPGMGSHIVISLPLTLAILPVLMLKLVDQPYAIPLSVVREIIPLRQEEMHTVGSNQALTIRGEILPVIDLAVLLGRQREEPPSLAVVLAYGERQLVLGVDGFIGQDEVMIKPLEGIHPKGVAGATLSGDGTLVLVLEMKQLLEGVF